ncbi:TetR/AcrR family transcriptional regulator [soil metagenome]
MSTRLPAPARREQILAVALAVFSVDGYHNTSMNEVAEAAGVTKPVLYQHFDSKRELYRALLDEVGERLLAAITEATATVTDGKSRTEAGFLGYFRWVAEDHASFRLLFGGGARRDDEFSAAVRRVTAAAAGAIAPLIEFEIDEERKLMLAHALVGLAEGASRMLVDHGEVFDPDDVAAAVSGLAWAGLRAVQRDA